MAPSQPSPSLQFTHASTDLFGPRLGSLILRRPNGTEIALNTPALLTSTSRGVVRHLSRDHCRLTKAIGWVHVPFETFLEQSPPVPTLQPGPHALHRFLGFVPADHLLSMSVRDPGDVREMPANGNSHVSAYSLRGVRKISPADWCAYTAACQPDIVVALTDTPHTTPPFSQKRLTKSIDRSTAWLASLLAPSPPPQQTTPPPPRPAVFVHLAGAASHPARAAFAASLIEPLSPIGALPSLDAGVAGYTLDLAPLRLAVSASSTSDPGAAPLETDLATKEEEETHSLLRTSLLRLPSTKPRLVNGTRGPHEVLRLIRDVGVDVLEARWAGEAAGVGVALDFVFPVGEGVAGGKRELGRNLYEGRYALDFGGLSNGEGGCACACACVACERVGREGRIVHAPGEEEEEGAGGGGGERREGYTRAYVHHLLHTHEMSAHALLVMHNLAVVDRFLSGVRAVLARPLSLENAALGGEGDAGREGDFKEEVRKFEEMYEEEMRMVEEARKAWRVVDMARGKGRLARERESVEV